MFKKLSLSAVAVALAVTPMLSQAKLDAGIPTYTKAAGVAGNLSSVGSDTLANVMTLWAEEYKKLYPNVNMQIQAAGSSTAPPALTGGTANFGPMSRIMKGDEIAKFEAKYGYKPTAVPVAVDGLAIYVHKDNPLRSLTIQQIDGIFSSTRKCGSPKPINTWGAAGLSGAWANRPIQLYGRNSVSGTYGYFKEHALCKGDFITGVKEQPGSAAVVQAVSTNINGIGYSGMGYNTSSVREVPIQNKDGEFYMPTQANALSGKYPLARYLYVYVNKAPGKPLPPSQAEFLRMVLSQTGQRVVEKDGFIPLPVRDVVRTRQMLGL